VWDYPGHFFHLRDEELKEFLLAKMDRGNVLEVKKTESNQNKRFLC